MCKPNEPSRRKWRRYFIHPTGLLDYLRTGSALPRHMIVPVVKGPPDGAKVVNVAYDWDRQGLAVIVEHDSFSVVPDGDEIPQGDEPMVIGTCFLEVVNCLAADFQLYKTSTLESMRAALDVVISRREKEAEGTKSTDRVCDEVERKLNTWNPTVENMQE